jgi:hypothetical protein
VTPECRDVMRGLLMYYVLPYQFAVQSIGHRQLAVTTSKTMRLSRACGEANGRAELARRREGKVVQCQGVVLYRRSRVQLIVYLTARMEAP